MTVLAETLSDYLGDSSIGSTEVIEVILRFILVTFGSLGIGLLCGAGATIYFWIMKGSLSTLLEVISFFSWALIPFWLCDGIDWSGIVAIVAAAFVLDIYVSRIVSIIYMDLI